MHTYLLPLFRSVVSLVAPLVLAVSPLAVGQTVSFTGFLVGTGNSTKPGVIAGGIYAADLLGNVTLVHDTTFGGINGLALDSANNMAYFHRNNTNTLYSYDLVTRQQTEILATGVGAVFSAGWYDGKYYFTASGSGVLREWDPSAPGVTNVVATMRNVTNTATLALSAGDLTFGTGGNNMWITGTAGDSFLVRYSVADLLGGGNVAAGNLTNLTTAGPTFPAGLNGITQAPGALYGYRQAAGTLYQLQPTGANMGEIINPVVSHPIFEGGGDLTGIATFDITFIPEPSSSLTLLLSLGAFVLRRKR